MSTRSTKSDCCRRLRWRFWRASRRRSLRVRALRFLESWWYATWLYLGFIAVLAAFFADKVTVEPIVIVLCVTMVLTVRDLKTNQLVSILTGVLGILAVFLAFPAGSEVGVWNLGLWAIVGLLIGLATVTALIFTVVWESIRRSKGRRRNLR